MIRSLVLLTAFMMANAAYAQSTSALIKTLPIQRQAPALSITWNIEEVTDGSVAEEIVTDTREKPDGDVLPDGRIEVADPVQDIEEAWYSEPTERYRHGVLGDAIEAGALKIRTRLGAVYTYRLPKTEVFEDITPRLADLDGDGTTEVITILASRSEGASVAIFGLEGNALLKKGQTSFIGRSNRWLNIAGIDNYAGGRQLDILVIETPHLAGIFKLYRYNRGQVGRSNRITPGFSNHQIGSRELRLSATTNIDNDRLPDLLIPSLDRRTLLGISVAKGQVKLLTSVSLPAAINRAIAVEGTGDDMKITVGLDDGKIYRLTPQ